MNLVFLCLVFFQAYNLVIFFGERHGIYPILSVYNGFLRACAKMRSIVHANQCLDLMEHRMVGKNEVTYSELLKVCKLKECWCWYDSSYSLLSLSLSSSLSSVLSTIVRHLTIFVVSFFMFLLLIL
jgi:pentatricopeptide repeat protein